MRRNFFKDLTYDRDAKRNYKKIRTGIIDAIHKDLDQYKAIAPPLLDEYLTCIGQAGNKFGHCKDLKTGDRGDTYTATYEYNILKRHTIVVDVFQTYRLDYTNHDIYCKFFILDGDKQLISFQVNYKQLVTESQKDASVFNDSADSTLSLLCKERIYDNYIR